MRIAALLSGLACAAEAVAVAGGWPEDFRHAPAEVGYHYSDPAPAVPKYQSLDEVNAKRNNIPRPGKAKAAEPKAAKEAPPSKVAEKPAQLQLLRRGAGAAAVA